MTMLEPELEKNEIQLFSNYRLGFDKLNYILSKRYQKRDGKGVNAPFKDEYGYDKANQSYFGNPKVLANRLVDKEFLGSLNEEDQAEARNIYDAINKAIAHTDKVKQEIFEHINSHITIDLGESSKKSSRTVRGVKIDDSLENEED